MPSVNGLNKSSHPVNVISIDSEQELVKQSQQGSKKAYERLYRLNTGKIYALCLRLCGDREIAEDLTQEAFVKAWQKIRSFRGESAFGSWLYRLTTNLVISYLRQQSQWNMKNQSVIHDNLDSDLSFIHEEIIDIKDAILSLPTQARVVLILYEVAGYQHNEIADITGLAVGTSKAQLHRAKKLLKQRLKI